MRDHFINGCYANSKCTMCPYMHHMLGLVAGALRPCNMKGHIRTLIILPMDLMHILNALCVLTTATLLGFGYWGFKPMQHLRTYQDVDHFINGFNANCKCTILPSNHHILGLVVGTLHPCNS